MRYVYVNIDDLGPHGGDSSDRSGRCAIGFGVVRGSRGREALRIVRAATDISGSVQHAFFWFRDESLRTFGGKTTGELVSEERTVTYKVARPIKNRNFAHQAINVPFRIRVVADRCVPAYVRIARSQDISQSRSYQETTHERFAGLSCFSMIATLKRRSVLMQNKISA